MKVQSLFASIRILDVVHRCMLRFGSVLLCIVLCAAADGQASTGYTNQDVSSATLAANCEWSLTKDVDEVNVLFLATRRGKFIGGLSQNDLVVLNDKKPPAAVLGFRTEEGLPLRVGLMIDTSESLNSRFRFEQKGASAFLDQAVRRDADQAFVLGFSDKPRVRLQRSIIQTSAPSTKSASMVTSPSSSWSENKDATFRSLEMAYKQHSATLTSLAVDPFWSGIRSDPRYADLLRRMGLPQ